MADRTAEPRITLHPHSRRVRILADDTLIADTRNAIELRERGYSLRPEFQKELPRASVDMSTLSVSSTVTHCPDTTYDSLPDIDDEAWSHECPIDEMQSIAGRLAFDARKVTELVEWRPLSTQSGHAGKGCLHVHRCYAAVTMIGVIQPSYT
ncbi:DUF427 domain-containing protein [Modicisalibacter coralii]|uniref:DUF427 domain-containing protein n=1 Tax=Modicisalibacter coralii TaxID=2304602 RepID=UPI00100A59F4|nr:DUF427 domain-containing protein [Halomonas coralii]